MRAPDSASNWRGRSSGALRSPLMKWCRMMESNHHLAIIDRGLDLRANPAWCAVWESNPHLLVVSQLFSSVELPAQQFMVRDAGIEPASSRLKGECIATSANPAKSGGGYRSRTCLAALIWRRSAYKALPLPEDPLKLVARDGFEPSTTAL